MSSFAPQRRVDRNEPLKQRSFFVCFHILAASLSFHCFIGKVSLEILEAS